MVLSKKYRCNAPRKASQSVLNPFEEMNGFSRFSENDFPVYFESDDLAEMEKFVEENGIVCFEE